MSVSSADSNLKSDIGAEMTRQRRKDEVFYITTVVFLVEDTLFRLPRGPFVDQSAFFRQRILQRAPEIVKPGGSSDDVPFHLESIEKDDFKQLLKVLFPPRPVKLGNLKGKGPIRRSRTPFPGSGSRRAPQFFREKYQSVGSAAEHNQTIGHGGMRGKKKRPKKPSPSHEEAPSYSYEKDQSGVEHDQITGHTDEKGLREGTSLSKASSPSATDAPQTYSEWAAVLKLSTKWGFENARQQAIDQMESMSIDPIDKICLARDYDVDEWLAPAVNDLVKREEPINVNDVDRLGLEFALKVAAIRERVANHPSASLQIGGRQVEHLDFTSSVAAMLVSIDMAS